MAEKAFKLSTTARAMLTLAASREDRLVRPPQLPIAAARQVVRSMLNNGLAEEAPAPIGDPADTWRTAEDGTVLMLRATPQGMAAIGEAASESVDLPGSTEAFAQVVSKQGRQTLVNEDEAQTVVEDHHAMDASTQVEFAPESLTAPHTAARGVEAADATPDTNARPEPLQPPARVNLRQAALVLLEVWNNAASRAPTLDQPMAALRLALDERAPRTTTAVPRKPRENTKQAQILSILRRAEGATIAEIIGVTNWQPHTASAPPIAIINALHRVRRNGA